MHKTDMIPEGQSHEYEGFVCMYITTVIKCNLLSYVIFNAKMTLFEMFLLWARVRGKGRLGLGQVVSSLH